MAESKLRDLSTDFAVKVIKMCDSKRKSVFCELTCRIYRNLTEYATTAEGVIV